MFEAGPETTAHDDIDITTTSGRSSDDPIKLGDELKYKDLMERVTRIESSVDDIKSLLQQLIATKSQPSAPTTADLKEALKPLFEQQQHYLDLQHKHHVNNVRNMFESRYQSHQSSSTHNHWSCTSNDYLCYNR